MPVNAGYSLAFTTKIIYPRKMLDIQLVRYLVTLYFQNVIGHSSVMDELSSSFQEMFQRVLSFESEKNFNRIRSVEHGP